MKTVTLGKTGPQVPAIAVGCMRLGRLGPKEMAAHIQSCLDLGLNFFDHADIYQSDAGFAQGVKELGVSRDRLVLQSKCGIRQGMYDFSKEYILEAVDGILTRMETDYLDVLVLHRPDALMEPEEVAEAFDRLEQSGKVRYFGVSNHRPGQIELLKTCVRQELLVDQLQFSIPFSSMVAAGFEANTLGDGAADRDGGVLDYCRLHGMTVQAWSPFQYGFFTGPFVGNREKFPELNQALDELSEKYAATPTALATAWLLRHPAKVQVIAGTTSPDRMAEIVRGSEITLDRADWYKLYTSAGHTLP